MTIVAAFASAKHSPGTTTTALALAVALTGTGTGADTVLVEADPDGGDLAARLFRDPPGVSLATLAPAARHGVDEERLAEHSRELRAGLRLLSGPMSASESAAALHAVGPQLADHLAGSSTTVVVDVGRLSGESPALPLARASEAIVWVLRPTLEGARHVRARLDDLGRSQPGLVERSVLVVVNGGDYDAEAMRQLGRPVLGAIEFDPRGVGTLHGRPGWRGTGLMRDARALAAALVRRRESAPVGRAGR